MVYETKNPNSVRTNWPVLECICDENNKASLSLSLLPIEREFLEDKVIKIKTGENKWREHKIKFVNSMTDEKHDKSISGYQGSGSGYICVLCHATHATCKSNLGTFRIDRLHDETRNLAHYILFNPDKFSDKDLSKVAQGVSHLPVSHCDPLDKILDATHADINIGIFFKKLIIRIEADLDQWDATQAVSEKLKNVEHNLIYI